MANYIVFIILFINFYYRCTYTLRPGGRWLCGPCALNKNKSFLEDRKEKQQQKGTRTMRQAFAVLCFMPAPGKRAEAVACGKPVSQCTTIFPLILIGVAACNERLSTWPLSESSRNPLKRRT